MALSFQELEKPYLELDASFRKLRDFCRDNAIEMERGLGFLEEQTMRLQTQECASLTALQKVQMARHPLRPYPWDLQERIFRNFQELHGDRRFADDAAIFGGIAELDGQPLLVLGTRKGRDLTESMNVNFGSAHPEGYRKAMRLMRLADKLGLPIVNLVDTPGAYPGIAAEERHIGEAIACNLRDMFRLGVPVISIITGEGGSGGALGLSVANRVLMLDNAYYSVITPEGCAAILWRSAEAAPQAAEALHLTCTSLLRLGVVDAVIPEPPGGAHRDWDATAAFVRQALLDNLRQLKQLTPEQLRQGRFDRFRKLGQYAEY